jgi:hypothetical protein
MELRVASKFRGHGVAYLKAMSAFTTAVKNPNLEVFMKASY